MSLLEGMRANLKKVPCNGAVSYRGDDGSIQGDKEHAEKDGADQEGRPEG